MTTSPRAEPVRPPTAAPRPRSVWVWDEPSPADLVRWSAAKGVGVLFVAVPTDLATAPRLHWLRLLRAGLAPGMSLQLLGGDPCWLDDLAEARRWWAAATGAGGATAVHLDLEPWAHPDWDTDRRPGLVRAYLGLLQEFSSGNVRLEVDLAHHLHRVHTDTGEQLDRAVLGLVDAVTLMTYRRHVHGPNGLLDIARPTLTAALERRRPVRLAVACSPVADDPTGEQGFHGRPEHEMLSALSEVEGLLAGRPAWRGMAVHDRAGWAALPR